jgi:hypothetical protein
MPEVPSQSPVVAPIGERRRYPRIAVLDEFQGRFESVDWSIRACDISEGGFSIEAQVPFESGDIREFLFTRDDGVSVLITAQAVHSREVDSGGATPVYQIGFEFLRDDPRTRRTVDELIAQMTSIPDVI